MSKYENGCFTMVCAHFAVWGCFGSHEHTMEGTIYENTYGVM